MSDDMYTAEYTVHCTPLYNFPSQPFTFFPGASSPQMMGRMWARCGGSNEAPTSSRMPVTIARPTSSTATLYLAV